MNNNHLVSWSSEYSYYDCSRCERLVLFNNVQITTDTN